MADYSNNANSESQIACHSQAKEAQNSLDTINHALGQAISIASTPLNL